MNEIDFTIGDDIVCIKTHPQKVIKEGDVFTVLALKHSLCTKCGGILVDVGIKNNVDAELGSLIQCSNGHNIAYPNDGIWWFAANRFKKLDTLVDISELTEVLETSIFE